MFREDETDQFPVHQEGRTIWYAIIVMDCRFPRYEFTSSSSGKRHLVEQLKFLKDEGQKYLILGMWQGKWRTDIFILDERTLIKRVKEALA